MFDDRVANIVTVTTVTTLFFTMIIYGIQKLQEMLVYPSNIPEGSRTQVDTPKKYNIPYEEIRLKTADGESLQAYIMTVSINYIVFFIYYLLTDIILFLA